MPISSRSTARRAERRTMASEAQRTGRTTLAVIFGPPIGSAVGISLLGVLSSVIWFVRFGEPFPSVHGLWTFPFVGAGIGVLLGIPAMLFAGLPVHALLHHYRFRSAVIYAVAGASAGLLLALVAGHLGLLTLLNSDLPPEEEPPSDLLSAVWVSPQAVTLGMSSALGFWLIRRPDRDAPNPPTSTP
jgi:hypothetical protein